MRIQLNSLKLVYPPISNQEMEWLGHDVAVREEVMTSKLYMIGQRSELLFSAYGVDEEHQAIEFELSRPHSPDVLRVTLPIVPLIGDFEGAVEVEIGDKIIRIWPDPRPPAAEPLVWFTPDKFLYNLSNGHLKASDRTFPRSLTTYDLLYVGISKESDSFSRLFETGHHARTKILSNEHQHYPTARVTDEMTLFLFDIESFGIGVHSFEGYPEDVGMDFRAEQIRVVADAEKAFVKMLGPRYNEVGYRQYPRGTDGLYGSGLSGYTYAIREDLTFVTPSGRLRGSVRDDGHDLIHVVANEVRVIHWEAASFVAEEKSTDRG